MAHTGNGDGGKAARSLRAVLDELDHAGEFLAAGHVAMAIDVLERSALPNAGLPVAERNSPGYQHRES